MNQDVASDLLSLLGLDLKIYLDLYTKKFNYRDYFTVREYALLRMKLRYLSQYELAIKPRGFFYENMVKYKFKKVKRDLDVYIDSLKEEIDDVYNDSDYKLIRDSLAVGDCCLDLEVKKEFTLKPPVFRDIQEVGIDHVKTLSEVRECLINSYQFENGESYVEGEIPKFDQDMSVSTELQNIKRMRSNFTEVHKELIGSAKGKDAVIERLSKIIPGVHNSARYNLPKGVAFSVPKCGAVFEKRRFMTPDGIKVRDTGYTVCNLLVQDGNLKKVQDAIYGTGKIEMAHQKNKRKFEREKERFRVAERKVSVANYDISSRNDEKKRRFATGGHPEYKDFDKKCVIWGDIIKLRDEKILALREDRVAKRSLENKQLKLRVRKLMDEHAYDLIGHQVGGSYAGWDKKNLTFYQKYVPDLSWTAEEDLQYMFESMAARFNLFMKRDLPKIVDMAITSNYRVEKVAVNIDYAKLLRTKRVRVMEEGHRSKKTKACLLALTLDDFISILKYRAEVGYCSKIPFVPLSHRLIKFINL